MVGEIIGFTLIGLICVMPFVAVGLQKAGHWMLDPPLREDETPLDRARVEYVHGGMSLPEFEAVSENYLAGRPHCRGCGRFPVERDELCQRHKV